MVSLRNPIFLALLRQQNKQSNLFSQNGACLVGKMIPHPVGVFCTHLEGPNGHISKTSFFVWRFRPTPVKTSLKVHPSNALQIFEETLPNPSKHNLSELCLSPCAQPKGISLPLLSGGCPFCTFYPSYQPDWH